VRRTIVAEFCRRHLGVIRRAEIVAGAQLAKVGEQKQKQRQKQRQRARDKLETSCRHLGAASDALPPAQDNQSFGPPSKLRDRHRPVAALSSPETPGQLANWPTGQVEAAKRASCPCVTNDFFILPHELPTNAARGQLHAPPHTVCGAHTQSAAPTHSLRGPHTHFRRQTGQQTSGAQSVTVAQKHLEATSGQAER